MIGGEQRAVKVAGILLSAHDTTLYLIKGQRSAPVDFDDFGKIGHRKPELSARLEQFMPSFQHSELQLVRYMFKDVTRVDQFRRLGGQRRHQR